jgi:quinol monooxygenase YgiN
MRQTAFAILVTALFSIAWPGAAHAQSQPQVYVITHVDIAPLPPAPGVTVDPAVPAKTMPQVTADGETILHQFAAESRKDPGCVSFEVLQEPQRRNHFTLVQVWRDENAFIAHEAAAHSRATREKLQPILGGPLDQRAHLLID